LQEPRNPNNAACDNLADPIAYSTECLDPSKPLSPSQLEEFEQLVESIEGKNIHFFAKINDYIHQDLIEEFIRN
jgi:hypothetical protein